MCPVGQRRQPSRLPSGRPAYSRVGFVDSIAEEGAAAGIAFRRSGSGHVPSFRRAGSTRYGSGFAIQSPFEASPFEERRMSVETEEEMDGGATDGDGDAVAPLRGSHRRPSALMADADELLRQRTWGRVAGGAGRPIGATSSAKRRAPSLRSHQVSLAPSDFDSLMGSPPQS